MEEKKPVDKKFYIGLLISCVSGLFLIAGLLTYLWLGLIDYEECFADNIIEELSERYSGNDIYFYEDTVKGSGVKRYRIQDGDKRLATVILEPDGPRTGFDHQKYKVLFVENEKDTLNDAMQVVDTSELLLQSEETDEENTVSGNVSENDAEEEKPSLPITPEEETEVSELAQAYVKVYAPFSTIKDIGDLRSKVLSMIKEDTTLYERLKTYHNEWGQNVSKYDFGDTEVKNIKKTGENEYECDVESKFITSSADWGVKRDYDMSYHMMMERTDSGLLLTSVE